MQAASVVWARPVERYRHLRSLGVRPSGGAQLVEDRCTGDAAVVHVACWSARDQRERAARLQETAWLVVRIEHRNVLAVRDLFFVEDGRPCLVTEHVEGGSLAELVAARGGWLPPHEALAIVCEVLEGLVALHGWGLVHGALLPESVRVCPGEDGRPMVKIADVGTAAGLPDPRLLADGGAAWMRADVFAVASMLESLLTAAGRHRGAPQGAPMAAGPAAGALDALLRHALGARSGGFESAEALLHALLRVDRAALYAAPEAALAATSPDLARSGVRWVARPPVGSCSTAPPGGGDALDTTASHRLAHARRRGLGPRERWVLAAVLSAGLMASMLLCWALVLALR
ncbi:MAG: protein kinase [Polyangiaceae bacterium]